MYISRLVIRNFRNFKHLDIPLQPGVTCVVGENNTGKTNLLHALRLVLDVNLSSTYRQLIEHDLHSDTDFTEANQALISVQFSDYKDQENEVALVGLWEVAENTARLTFRFRPRQTIREKIENEDHDGTGLRLDDYHWELTGGGPNDPATAQWDEDLGSSIRFSDLQAFQVIFLPALRDVQNDLRNSRISPLARLLDAVDIVQDEKDALVRILKQANDDVAARPFIQTTGTSIQDAFAKTAGEAFPLQTRLGMVDPSFASIARALTILLTNPALSDFEPSRNGLGLNNVLYISMLLQYFALRAESAKAAGQLLLIEEPEAHLHPQLQRTLYNALGQEDFQAILTSHSTHVSSHAPLKSLVVLTNAGSPAIQSSVPATNANLSAGELADLERYLDATRSALLFARKVILVEGPAELFIIPRLVKHVMDIDFDRLGISVIPIFGVHFSAYAKLFTADSLPKKCAIIADGDLRPSDARKSGDEEDVIETPDLKLPPTKYLRVFRCTTTFERVLTQQGNLLFLARTAQACKAPTATLRLRQIHAALPSLDDDDQRKELISEARRRVLRLSIRVGKARFAQVASRHIELAETVPSYIKKAVRWLIK